MSGEHFKGLAAHIWGCGNCQIGITPNVSLRACCSQNLKWLKQILYHFIISSRVAPGVVSLTVHLVHVESPGKKVWVGHCPDQVGE